MDPITAATSTHSAEEVVALIAGGTHAAFPGSGHSTLVDRQDRNRPVADVTAQLREAHRRGLATCNGLVWIPTPPGEATS